MKTMKCQMPVNGHAFPPLHAAAHQQRWFMLAGVLVLAAVSAALLQWLWSAGQRGLPGLDFGFLQRTSGVGISESMLAYTQEDTFLRLILAGFANTVFLVLPVCVAAFLIGLAVGILRLSDNPLLAAMTAAYVQVMRNVPLILQILLWYAVFLKLPSVAQSLALGDWFFLNQRGAFLPGFSLAAGGFFKLLGAAALGAVGFLCWRRWSATGHTRRWRYCFGLLLLLVIGWLLSSALQVELPRKGNFNFSGGASVSVEFFTLFVALSVYTSAYIAEVVRGGVLSVRRDQWAAAQALGMGYGQALFLVILPQAWLAIIPPLVSQIVNVVKNSSLAIAIGFPDLLWALTTVIGVTNRTVESVVLLFVLYLIPSLLAAWLLGVVNDRMLQRHGTART